MSAFRGSQPTFSSLEIAPEVEARSDVAKYQSALRQARNVLGRPAGGVVKRQGTLYQGYARNELHPVRLIPFQFSADDQAVLEFGDGYMRVLAGGGYELEEDLAPAAITNANPAVVTFAGHPLSPGDDIYWSGVSGMVEINGQTTRVLGTTSNTFSIDLDTTTYSTFTGAAGDSSYAPSPPAPPAGTPPPPSPPPPTSPPAPPGPDGGGSTPHCVAPETMILTSDRIEVRADHLKVGDSLRTQHEDTLAWGDFRITAIEMVAAERWAYGAGPNRLVATPDHRIMLFDGLNLWREIRYLGAKPLDHGPVMQITVETAHTYVSNGVLSHNIKIISPSP